MENAAIAAALIQIAESLEGSGANPWRIRAYRRAARSVERHDTQVIRMLAAGQPLSALAGVGAELGKLIEELATTGGARALDELAARPPPPKSKARRRRPDAGERAMRLTEAMPIAAALVAFLQGSPAAARVEPAGDFRRRLERVDRLELLVASDDPAAVVDHLVGHAGLDELAAAGNAVTARLRGALPIRVEIVPPARWGSALVEATGPPEHVRALRAAAGTTRAFAEEEAVYRAAGLPLTPPELRADGSELARELPRLLEPGEIRGDLQMHSLWSDGTATIAAMAAACRKQGYEYLAMTDHSGSLTIAHGLRPERLEQQWREIDALRAEEPGIVVLKSMEVDILPDGSLDLPESHLGRLDCVLAAVHVQQKLPRAHQTERILRAVAHPAVDILGHPTGKRGPRPSYDVDLDAVLRACAAAGVAVELDCSPDRSDLSAENVRRALALGCTIVIDTDAHSQRELANMGYGVGQARRAGAEADRVLNTRGWGEFRRWLQRRGGRRELAELGNR